MSRRPWAAGVPRRPLRAGVRGGDRVSSPSAGPGDFYDPRKHAVAVTYAAACECTGEPKAMGEELPSSAGSPLTSYPRG